MSKLRFVLLLSLAAALALTLAACGDDDDSSDDATETTAAAEDCTPEGMDTAEPGVLTVATDKPAFPPYFEDDDPTNGRGFESAVAYAIARELGFQESEVAPSRSEPFFTTIAWSAS